MKFTEVLTRSARIERANPRLMRRPDAGAYVGTSQLLARMEQAGWVRPVINEHKMTFYDLRQLDRCVDRLAAGDLPSSMS